MTDVEWFTPCGANGFWRRHSNPNGCCAVVPRGARGAASPLGWRSDHEDAERTAPHGAAATDANFAGGGDQVRYEVLAPTSRGPYRLEAKLLYQAIGQRFAAELLEYDTPEIQTWPSY